MKRPLRIRIGNITVSGDVERHGTSGVSRAVEREVMRVLGGRGRPAAEAAAIARAVAARVAAKEPRK